MTAPGAVAPVSKTKWIVQLVITIVVLGNPVALVLSILGLVKVDTDLPAAEKFYKWAWIAYAIGVILWIIVIILYIVLIVSIATDPSMTPTY